MLLITYIWFILALAEIGQTVPAGNQNSESCPADPGWLVDPCFSPCTPGAKCPTGQKCCPVQGCHTCLPVEKPNTKVCPTKEANVFCWRNPCDPNPCPAKNPAKPQCCADYSVGCNYSCI